MRKTLAAVLLLFVLSGACGLVYQVAWLRLLTLTFGSTVHAVATLLTAFMGGLALGSAAIGRLTPGLRRPLLAYGLLELIIGAYGILSLWLFSSLDGAYILFYRSLDPGGTPFALLRLLFALAILLPPTTLMGGTLPVLARFAIRRREWTGKRAGLLYFANTAGAVIGCAAAGFLLLPGLGLRRTILVAAAGNALVFLLALLLSRASGEGREREGEARDRLPGGEEPGRGSAVPVQAEGGVGADAGSLAEAGPGLAAPVPSAGAALPARLGTLGQAAGWLPAPGAAAPDPSPHRRAYYWFFFFTGLASLAYEVYWTRILVLYLGSSVYAYSVMLTVLLLGLAGGSLILAPLADRLRPAALARWFGVVELLLGLSVLLQISQFAGLSETIGNMVASFGEPTHWKMTLVYFLAAGQVILLPTVLMGASFPLAARGVAGPPGRAGRDLGALYGMNTLGAILGSFAAGFILVPLLGVQDSLALTAPVNLAVGGAALLLPAAGRRSRAARAAVPILVVAAFLGVYIRTVPRDVVLLSAGVFRHAGVKEVIHHEEDAFATVTVEEMADLRGDWRSISLNGVNVAGTSMDLLTVQKMQGHLPLLLHGRARRVLHIGFGSGGTARAVSCYPVEEIRVAEMCPSVVRAAQSFFFEVNRGFWLRDERVRFTWCDGRNFVLAAPERFDAILSDSIHPKFAGNGSLYTREYYELCRRRLNPGGVVSQWLPIYSLTADNLKMILRAFQEVFPETWVFYVNSAINPFTIVVGREGRGGIDVARLVELLQRPAVAADLAEIGEGEPAALLDNFLFGAGPLAAYAGGVPPHSDDWPAVEYQSARLLDRQASWRENFEQLLPYREPVLPYLDWSACPPGMREELEPRLARYFAASGHNLRGQARFLRQEVPEMLAEFAEALRLNPEDQEPWEYTRFYLAGRGFPGALTAAEAER